MSKGITEFLKTKRSESELRTALTVLREFKSCESRDEWLELSFIAWTKLEQLEEFLDHIVNGTPLKKDTIEYIHRMEKLHD